MTICIAAICDGNKIVAITDKMLTLGQPITTTFEATESDKAFQFGDKVVALFAGDVIHANEILKRAKSKIDSLKPGSYTVLDIANMTKQAFVEHWEGLLSNFLTIRFKVDLKTFMQNQGSFHPDLIKSVNDIISKFNIEVQIIIAGIDTAPRIYYLDNLGSVVERTALGYASIGSGEKHASLSLIESEYRSSFSLKEALFALLEAKKRAEYDPGVGEFCDIVIIDGGFEKLTDDKMGKILKIYDKSQTTINRNKKKYADKIEAAINE